MTPLALHRPQPSHPSILKVIHVPGAYASLSRSTIDLPPGALLARLATPPLKFAQKAYSTVQVSRTQHIELNCDFLFINHSCDPSVEFHVLHGHPSQEGRLIEDGAATNGATDAGMAIAIRVARRKDSSGNLVGLRKGDELTFFYPSTEWEMEQPFECKCGARSCRGSISGAKDMGSVGIGELFVNEHIRELLKVQEASLEGNEERYGSSARALAGEMGGDTMH